MTEEKETVVEEKTAEVEEKTTPVVDEKPKSKIQEASEKKAEQPVEFVLTDELRKKALEKPTFKILYVGDGDSRLSPFRGESMLRTFSLFYERQAHIEYYTITPSKLGKMTLDDLKDVNILWVDNISSFAAIKNMADLQGELMNQIEPDWKKKIEELSKEDKEKAKVYAEELNEKRTEKIRIIYSVDEFIWEGAVGRSRDVQTVQLMETAMNIADTVVVPNPELREAILYYRFIQDTNKEIYVIPSSVGVEFFPLYKNFTKTGKAELAQLRSKPKVLIKGLSVPKNIEEFIINNYRKMDITLCSIDEVNDHVRGLLARQKISHIYHWANPYVNRGNIIPTYAIERDSGFDFVIHTKPDNLKGDMFELTTGDEDILFSISYGALPICGIEHLGYDDNSKHLAMASGLTFGKDTKAKKIAGMIERYQTPALFNEAFNKCRQMVENRISTSPFIIARYFALMLGKDIARARAEIAKEKKEEIKIMQEQQKTVEEKEQQAPEKSAENVIEVDFKKGK